jgi:peroxiredoxin
MIKKLLTLALCLTALGAVNSTNANATATIGKAAPNFETVDTHGAAISLDQLKGKTVVLEWTNHNCPFVVKQYESGNMQKVQAAVAGEDVVWLSIISSAPNKQGAVNADEANAITKAANATPSHKILDPSGEIGRLYGAQTTPHMYVINAEGVLAYAGAIDDHTTWRQKGLDEAKNFVVAAISDLRAGKAVEVNQTKPYGCGIKY